MSNTSTSIRDIMDRIRDILKTRPPLFPERDEPWVDPTAPFEPFPIHPPFDDTFICPRCGRELKRAMWMVCPDCPKITC